MASTSYQGKRVSYYQQHGNRTLKTSGGSAYGRTAGGYYTVATPGGQQFTGRVPRKTYHRWILAEFVACVMMVAAGLVLLPAETAAGASAAGANPASYAKQLVQLTALCLLFFVLALAATGEKSGKVAAAFGGLITLGTAYHLSGIFNALAKTLTGAAAPGESPAQVLGGPVVNDTSQFSPQNLINSVSGPLPTPSGQAPAATQLTGGV